MNPFSLLSKGETVKGLKNRAATYKMLPGNALPNFSIPKRTPAATLHPEPGKGVLQQPQPAAATSTVAAATEEKPSKHHGSTESPPTGVGVPAEEKATQQAARTECAPCRVADPVEEKPCEPDGSTESCSTGVAAPAEEKPSKAGLWSRLAGIGAGWIGKWQARGKAAAGSPSVQTELALEKVTVIRNDLSDDDLEIVVGKRAGTKSEKAAQSQPFGPGNLAPNP